MLKESLFSGFHIVRTNLEFLEADLTSKAIPPDFLGIY